MLALIYLLLGVLGNSTASAPFACPQTLTATVQPSFAAPVLQTNNSINGHVSDQQRHPLRDLYVLLLNDVEAEVDRTKTDGSGRFYFKGMLSGTFRVQVLASGTDFASQTKEVDIANFGVRMEGGQVRQRGGESAQVDFVLSVKRNASSGASILSAPGTIFYQDVPPEAKRLYKKAVKDLDTNAEIGLSELKEAISVFPRYYDALEYLGVEYVKRKQFEPATPILVKAVEVNPRGQTSLYALGIAQYNLGQLSAAIESLRRSASINPNSINAHLWLGIVLLKDKRFDESETHLKRAYALAGSRVPVVHMHLAQLYSDTKHYQEAANELTLFLKEEPDCRDADSIRQVIQRLRTKAK